MGWAIALHGGAGDIPRDLSQERRQPREAALHHCLDIGVAAIKANKSPLDVVELVVCTYILIPSPSYCHFFPNVFLVILVNKFNLSEI